MSEKKPVLVREYVINLRRTREVSRTRRAKYAIRLIRRFVARHMKVDDLFRVRISNAVNEAVWTRGIEKPPRRIRVVVEKYEDGVVWVKLPEESGRG